MSIPIPNPIYLQALDGSTWVPAVDNTGRADTTSLTPPPGQSTIPWYELNDVSNGLTYRLVVQPCPSVPTGPSGELHIDETVSNPSAPNQLLVSAPNGIVYFLNISNGRLQSGLAVPANASCSTLISSLALRVLDRLEESETAPIFWNLPLEVLTAIVEAMNDLTLLVGRPVIGVQLPFNLNPNSVWQYFPKGILCFTDIYGPSSPLRKQTLFDYDYIQFNSGSDWENDTSTSGPSTWAPLGTTMFIVHPASSAPQQVTVNAILYPAPTPWPYSASLTVPFHDEFFAALESYAAHILRFKESGVDFSASMALYGDYLTQAERMSQIETRKDSLLFSRSFGVPFGTNPIQKR
ncbi:MAG TPA: hypothetical protein VN861_03260 [Candidatus Acidoferrales bacterium]|nr:hypothetical protein [Candidatus Acidoferrales bacterium]